MVHSLVPRPCKRSKTGGVEGLGTTLVEWHLCMFYSSLILFVVVKWHLFIVQLQHASLKRCFLVVSLIK